MLQITQPENLRFESPIVFLKALYTRQKLCYTIVPFVIIMFFFSSVPCL